MCVVFFVHPTDKDQSHVIGGYKAAITNPHTSAEAKEHAAERLQELGDPPSPAHEPPQHELGSHQIAGYKATISSSCDSPYLVSSRILKVGHSFIQTLTLRKKQNSTLVMFLRWRVN